MEGGLAGAFEGLEVQLIVPDLWQQDATRALANDKWREWTARGWDVGIATGDLAENLKAPILVATLETQRERLLSGDGPGLLIIDEYQMIGDRQRGLNYELAIALAPPTGLSIRNILPGTVTALVPFGPAQVDVAIGCGEATIWSRVTDIVAPDRG